MLNCYFAAEQIVLEKNGQKKFSQKEPFLTQKKQLFWHQKKTNPICKKKVRCKKKKNNYIL